MPPLMREAMLEGEIARLQGVIDLSYSQLLQQDYVSALGLLAGARTETQ